jgi:hypothetical protein
MGIAQTVSKTPITEVTTKTVVNKNPGKIRQYIHLLYRLPTPAFICMQIGIALIAYHMYPIGFSLYPNTCFTGIQIL